MILNVLSDIQARLEALLSAGQVFPGGATLVDPLTGQLKKNLPPEFVSFDLIVDTADVCTGRGHIKDSTARVQITSGAPSMPAALALAERVRDTLVPVFYYPSPLNFDGKLNGHFMAIQDYRRTH